MPQDIFTPREQEQRTLAIAGEEVRLTSYRLASRFSCRIDNIDPGSVIGRASAETRAEAEQLAIAQAESVLKLRASARAMRSSLDAIKLAKK